ncbi:hypothetical protein F443_13708 [Phytophthora nicotianae P1569]|uniref:Uncharacterized protein n=2 Tax=Phytophthora nicotianae TaxID=4792 RepID=V9EP40_PHYNI|nr:hypothetical protein F443_13708 [Phytophthora nicotianae P1569]ETO69690.1 hypothetical protein F444_13764 [Phytophthora nicotianae P1976]
MQAHEDSLRCSCQVHVRDTRTEFEAQDNNPLQANILSFRKRKIGLKPKQYGWREGVEDELLQNIARQKLLKDLERQSD